MENLRKEFKIIINDPKLFVLTIGFMVGLAFGGVIGICLGAILKFI